MARSKAKKIEECVTSLDIEVSRDDVARAFDEVYKEIAKIATVQGFRKGKAPLDLVKKQHAGDAQDEALKRLVLDAYRQAVDEHKLRPLGTPAISDVSFAEGAPLTFKARVDMRPDFKLKPYKGLKAERKKSVVSDEDITKTLESLREMHAKYNAADDRPVRMGDYVIGDLTCSVDGKEIHKKRENIWLAMEKDSFIPGLADGVIGMTKDQAKEIEVTLPEKYPDKAVAGKRATYGVTVKGIKVRELPAVDDELARDLGKADLATLKADIRTELEARMRANAEVEVENGLLHKLVEENVFPVPSGFVERQLTHMVENAKRKMMEKGLQKEDLDKKDGDFRKKYKDEAVRQVRLLFILDAIATAEGITISEDDIAAAYASIAAQSGKPEKEVRDHYEKEDIVDNLAEKLREEKTIRFVTENAAITEKSA